MKKVVGVYSAPRTHWVGDGFPVRSLLSYNTHGGHMSPFLLLDYAGPYRFAPGTTPRGVSQHPHRGFETVTIVYEGEVAHRDSTGADGVIGPGDVQWMTAASGIMHEEFHTPGFTQRGGTLEMVQLWVNLPARDKMGAPGYQLLHAAGIPTVALPDHAGHVRVIAGQFAGQCGPAHTHSPMNVWDIQLKQCSHTQFNVPDGWSLGVVVLKGAVKVNGAQAVRDAQMAMLDRAGAHVLLEALDDASILLLSGEPIDEPVVGHGPFVMNSQQDIVQALAEYDNGRFGQVKH